MIYINKNSLFSPQNKEDSEKDEKKDEEKQKSKRGRPPLKSTLSSNTSCSLSKTPNSEGKSGARSARNNLSDSSPLPNGTEGTSSALVFWHGSACKQ